MERDLAGVKLGETDFLVLADACRYDVRFPRRFEDWEALVARGTQAALAEGRTVTEHRLDAQEFLAWCDRVQIQPGLDAVRACCILARRRSVESPEK